MDHFEVTRILDSFRIIADTREQNTPRASERFQSFGAPVERATLSYGDYCANVTLPAGHLYDISSTIAPRCCIERKMSLDELAGCFTRGRDRFRREFERATQNHARIFLLIEGGNWESIEAHRYRSKFPPNAFKASLEAWVIRYNIIPIFCRAATSGTLIREFLYRDMKERLERGDYG